MYLTLLFALIGVIKAQSLCTLKAIDQCTCTDADTANCAILQTALDESMYAAAVTDTFTCDTKVGLCTLECVKNPSICGSAGMLAPDLAGAECVDAATAGTTAAICRLPTDTTVDTTSKPDTGTVTTSKPDTGGSDTTTTKGTITVPTCSVATYGSDACACTASDLSNCEALAASDSALSTVAAYGSFGCSADGYCTADCSDVPVGGTVVDGATICGQQSAIFSGLSFECDATTSLCLKSSSTDPGGDTTCAVDTSDIIGSVMDCECSTGDESNCVGLQASAGAGLSYLGLDTESVVCDTGEEHCTLSCTGGGQASCTKAQNFAGVTLECVSGFCRLSSGTSASTDTPSATDNDAETTSNDATGGSDDTTTTEEATTTTLNPDCKKRRPPPRGPPVAQDCFDDAFSDGCGVFITTKANLCNFEISTVYLLKLIIRMMFRDVVKAVADEVDLDISCAVDKIKLRELNVELISGNMMDADGTCLTEAECDSDDTAVWQLTSTVVLRCGDCDDLYDLGEGFQSMIDDDSFGITFDDIAQAVSADEDEICADGFGVVDLQTPIEMTVKMADGTTYTKTFGGSGGVRHDYLGAAVIGMAILSFIY